VKIIIVFASFITIMFGAIELWLGFTGVFGVQTYSAMIKGAVGIANACLLLALYANRNRQQRI
jgi:hypothetical protein